MSDTASIRDRASLDEAEPRRSRTRLQAFAEAMGRKWHHLATGRLGDVRPAIPLGKTFWELSEDE